MPERPTEEKVQKIKQLEDLIDTVFEMRREFARDFGYESDVRSAFYALALELGEFYLSTRFATEHDDLDEIPF